MTKLILALPSFANMAQKPVRASDCNRKGPPVRNVPTTATAFIMLPYTEHKLMNPASRPHIYVQKATNTAAPAAILPSNIN